MALAAPFLTTNPSHKVWFLKDLTKACDLRGISIIYAHDNPTADSNICPPHQVHLIFSKETSVGEDGAHVFHESIPPYNDCHTFLLTYNCERRIICTKSHSFSTIIKILNEPVSPRHCVICCKLLDPSVPRFDCHSCFAGICMVCMFSIILQRLKRYQPAMKHILARPLKSSDLHARLKLDIDCPICRRKFDSPLSILGALLDIKWDYISNEMGTDKKEELNILKLYCIRSNEHHHSSVMQVHADIHLRQLRNRLRIKIGTHVEMKGLKNKKHWNGKTAVVIGEPCLKKDCIRWPIQMDKTNERALVKSCNLTSL